MKTTIMFHQKRQNTCNIAITRNDTDSWIVSRIKSTNILTKTTNFQKISTLS